MFPDFLLFLDFLRCLNCQPILLFLPYHLDQLHHWCLDYPQCPDCRLFLGSQLNQQLLLCHLGLQDHPYQLFHQHHPECHQTYIQLLLSIDYLEHLECHWFQAYQQCLGYPLNQPYLRQHLYLAML